MLVIHKYQKYRTNILQKFNKRMTEVLQKKRKGILLRLFIPAHVRLSLNIISQT